VAASRTAAQDKPDSGINAGNYNIRQSFEFGGRATSVSGNGALYNTFVNLNPGPRLYEQTFKHLEKFKFKIPTRRRNRLAIGGYWDAIWPGSLQSAAKELNVQTVQINSQLCTRTQPEADSISARAEVIWRARAETSLKRASGIMGQLNSRKR